MRLNPDCIRDILLTTENLEDYYITSEDIPKDLSDYSFEEICYHAKQCSQSGYFGNFKTCIDGSFKITDLSPEGHTMIQFVRDNSGFNKIKNLIIKKGLPFTLASIKTIVELLT